MGPSRDGLKRTIYRVQDDEGRGPYRPGFSVKWGDPYGPPPPPPFWIEFGWEIGSVPKRFEIGEAGGSGFSTLDQLAQWFTPPELERLQTLGYFIARMEVDRILAESENQLVFARRDRLRDNFLVVPWSVLSELKATAS